MKTPDLAPEEMQLDIEYVNRILGIDFSSKDVKELLERMRYGVNLKANKIHVLIPAYRADILHPIDLVEDIA
ncbi:MAG: phenylalanine--tRNA ligase subunit beta, partial [Candidatus Altiarchaeota archaeon]|nr:phenylalanine--tRNA ligase subunit beta [Candidatus Altiarchaeota archaeon]